MFCFLCVYFQPSIYYIKKARQLKLLIFGCSPQKDAVSEVVSNAIKDSVFFNHPLEWKPL